MVLRGDGSVLRRVLFIFGTNPFCGDVPLRDVPACAIEAGLSQHISDI
jgi:hypothetical protein